jgi:hypothetical protein
VLLSPGHIPRPRSFPDAPLPRGLIPAHPLSLPRLPPHHRRRGAHRRRHPLLARRPRRRRWTRRRGPDGARLTPLIRYVGRGGNVVVCDAPVRVAVVDAVASGQINPWEATDHEDTIRARVAAAGRALAGTPYSFLDYLSLFLLHLGIRPAWLLRAVDNRRHMICSQLVDTAYEAAGLHLFTDGRFPGDVTPGDLDRYRIGHLDGHPELATAA